MRHLLVCAVMTFYAVNAHAQSSSQVVCTVNTGVPPIIRGEAYTELLGDLVLVCSGGTAGATQSVTIQLFLNTNVTSRIISGNQTEALLAVDDLIGTDHNLYKATWDASAPNRLTWTGIPFVAPGGGGAVRALRLTNVRANAAGLGVSGSPLPRVIGSLSVTPVGALSLDNPQQVLGFVQVGARTQIRNCAGAGAAVAGARSYSLQFQENSGVAFKQKMYDEQLTAGIGSWFLVSETGFVRNPPLLPANAGRADTGTRLIARFNDLPSGARVYVGTTAHVASPSTVAVLVPSDANGAPVTPSTPIPATTTIDCAGAATPVGGAEIPVSANTAMAVWEITSPGRGDVIDSLTFAFRVDVPGQSASYLPQVRMNLGPFYPSTSEAAQANAPLPIPRFQPITFAAGGSRFIPLETPCRLADTREANWPAPYGTPALPAGAERSIPFIGGRCPGLSSAAVAYSLNLTAIPRNTLGYMTIWPSGEVRPFVSTLNSVSGTIVANAAIVPVGRDGAFSVYATHDTDFVIDINGYFLPALSLGFGGLEFVPLTPCRIADSRESNRQPPFGAPILSAFNERVYGAKTAGCGVPQDARALVSNVTVVPTAGLGYLTMWPSGSARPFTSTMNALDGAVRANAAIATLGTGDGVSVFATNDTHVILDVNGVFAPRTGTGQFFPISPCRAVDTRETSFPAGLGVPSLADNETRAFPILASRCTIPVTPTAYSMNVTVVPRGALSYLTMFPADTVRPWVSTLNSLRGAIVANAAIVPAGPNGAVNVFASNATDVIIDLNGYFAP